MSEQDSDARPQQGQRLAGKVAVVSGAGSGIGRAAARLFASEGARVVLVGEALVRDGAPRDAVAAMTGINA